MSDLEQTKKLWTDHRDEDICVEVYRPESHSGTPRDYVRLAVFTDSGLAGMATVPHPRRER